jgi:hypothetical protein
MVAHQVRQPIFEQSDVRGKMALENNKKVEYVKCLLGEQQLSVVVISPSSSTGVT